MRGMKLTRCLVPLVLFSALFFGCSSNSLSKATDSGVGTVQVTVTSASLISNVDHLNVTVMAGSNTVMLAVVAPGTIPPDKKLDVDSHSDGPVTITVEADDVNNHPLGRGSGTANAVLDQTVQLVIALAPL
jgi:hypothetical protein